jgi:hypothetical protein
MKLQLTKESGLMFEKAKEEPFHSINQANGTSVESFFLLLKEIDRFILEFEHTIGMNGARAWIGERLHEAVNAERTTVEKHIKGLYFSTFEIISDTAHILIENYELTKMKVGLLSSIYCAYNFTVPRFMITRPVHEDTHAHLHKTEYSGLFSELVARTRERIEEKKPSAKRKIKYVSREFTAPIYVREMEEVFSRRMQRFALNAFLQRHYDHDPEWYGLLGVPLFLLQDPLVVKEITKITKREVEFKQGFLSLYRETLNAYVKSITKGEEVIHEDACMYLLQSTDHLINVVKKCLEGDYSDLKTIEREVVWRPGIKL